MSTYNHGITILENPTSIEQPLVALSAVQVVYGTAPVNLVAKPSVNKPVLLKTLDEAKKSFGYSRDFEKYTLCEAMFVNFEMLKVAPIVFVNVLDPDVHKKSIPDLSVQIINKVSVVKNEGILLNSLKVKESAGVTEYVEDVDYVAGFNDAGHVVISILPSGTIPVAATSLEVSFDELDPSAVTSAEIIGGYDSSTNTFSGLELTKTIFPTLNVIPNILTAPGYSHLPEVAAVLVAKSYKINGLFNATNVLDLVGKTKEEALTYKEESFYTDTSTIPCWPRAKVGGEIINYSTIVAAAYARRNAEDSDIPYRSASNMKVRIEGMFNSDGQEVFLDQVEANVLNAKGVVTAINMNGWRIWGNNTANFDADIPLIADPKDRFIAIRRMFNWWGNSFIINFFDELDGPISYRLIESIVDTENIRANGFQAQGIIAGAKIEFRQEDNPMNDILGGRIKFIQKVGFFTPLEEITNVLEFDPNILAANLSGGE